MEVLVFPASSIWRYACCFIVASILGIACSAHPFSAASPTQGVASRTLYLDIGGVNREALIHLPLGTPPVKPAALIVNFHGYGSNARQEEILSGMSDLADREGFVVAYPEGINRAWADGIGPEGECDLDFVRGLVTRLKSDYRIDFNRIFATGMSNGGGMANRAGCNLAEIFAAIGPVAGAYNFWEACHPSRPMPVIAFHGLSDNIVPFEGSGSGKALPPIGDWAAAWAKRNSCAAAFAETIPAEGVTLRTWNACAGAAEVRLYILADHGHSWPGSSVLPSATSRAVDATLAMWRFFQAHPMP